MRGLGAKTLRKKEEIILQYKRDGESAKSVATKVGLSERTVLRVLNDCGDDVVLQKINSHNKRHLSEIHFEKYRDVIIVVANNTGNKFLFDNTPEIYELLSQHTWQEVPNGYLGTGDCNKSKLAHRMILFLSEGDDVIVDHIDRNPKNNRMSNLRFASLGENRINAKINTNNKSGYKGVSYRKSTNKYRAYIWYKKQYIEIGSFSTAEQAYIARVKKEIELYGEYANIHQDFSYLKREEVALV